MRIFSNSILSRVFIGEEKVALRRFPQFGKISSFKNENPDISVIYTQNSAIVFIIKEFIVHDMYLIDVEENLVEQMKYIYGKGLKRLKDKVLGNNTKYRIH